MPFLSYIQLLGAAAWREGGGARRPAAIPGADGAAPESPV